MIRLTLITVSHWGNILLTLTLPSRLVTAPAIVQRTQGAAGALLAAVRVLRGEVPVAGRAVITPHATDISLTVTLTSHGLLAGDLVTVTVVSRPIRLTVALTADIRVSYRFVRVLGEVFSEERDGWCDSTHLVEAIDTHVAVLTPGVMLTLQTHSATDLTAGLETNKVKLSSSASRELLLTANTLESYLHLSEWLLQLHFLHSFFIFPVAGLQGTSW